LHLSDAIERQLAEVKQRTELLSRLKSEVDTINNIDKDRRTQLEAQREQLEADRATYREKLRIVEHDLLTVENHIKASEEDKRRKVDDLYRNFQSHGLPITDH